MPLYETVLITRPDLTLEDVDNLVNKLNKIVTDFGGKIASKEYWGLINIAYPIKKNTKGHYVLLDINSQYPAVQELERVVKYNEDVIRSRVFKTKKHITKSKLYISSNAIDYHKEKEKSKEEDNNIPSKLDLIIDRMNFDSY